MFLEDKPCNIYYRQQCCRNIFTRRTRFTEQLRPQGGWARAGHSIKKQTKWESQRERERHSIKEETKWESREWESAFWKRESGFVSVTAKGERERLWMKMLAYHLSYC